MLILNVIGYAIVFVVLAITYYILLAASPPTYRLSIFCTILPITLYRTTISIRSPNSRVGGVRISLMANPSTLVELL